MNKQSSPRISSLGARLMKITSEDIEGMARDATGDALERLAAEIRALAASCVSQDQTKGQE